MSESNDFEFGKINLSTTGEINISDGDNLAIQTGSEINISKFEIPQVDCVVCGKKHNQIALSIDSEPITDAELCADCYKKAFRLLVDLLERTED